MDIYWSKGSALRLVSSIYAQPLVCEIEKCIPLNMYQVHFSNCSLSRVSGIKRKDSLVRGCDFLAG